MDGGSPKKLRITLEYAVIGTKGCLRSVFEHQLILEPVSALGNAVCAYRIHQQCKRVFIVYSGLRSNAMSLRAWDALQFACFCLKMHLVF